MIMSNKDIEEYHNIGKETPRNNLRILSLGAGVQSSTLALKIKHGEIPMVDAAIFADVKGEPKAVYTCLDWLEKQLNYPVFSMHCLLNMC